MEYSKYFADKVKDLKFFKVDHLLKKSESLFVDKPNIKLQKRINTFSLIFYNLQLSALNSR